MIELHFGDILKANADALVNPVNCVGVMGRGLALHFKTAYPRMFECYQAVCKRGELKPGTVLTCDLRRTEQPHYVINFPTKRDWRAKSRIEDIESGLQALVAEVRRLGVQSVAVPPLGCGLGALAWDDVRPRIERAFVETPQVKVLLFQPMGVISPASDRSGRSTRA
jgi:O-acetyl-ADP-ribose deacetylase (regulator of RNase III)